jgi:hypothetical protein
MAHMDTDLYQYSIDQLASRQGDWPEIARSCEVSYSWLCKFAHGEIPNAAYKRVKRLASILDETAEPRTRRSTDKEAAQ